MPLSYRDAIAELETILRTLETDAVDVDDLTARVERSAELIRLCRQKLRHAEASLDRIFDTLDEEAETDEPEEELTEDLLDEEDEEDEDEEEEDDEESREKPGGAGRPGHPSWLF